MQSEPDIDLCSTAARVMGFELQEGYWMDNGSKRFRVAAGASDRPIAEYWRPDVWWPHLKLLIEHVRLMTGVLLVCSYEGPRGYVSIGKGNNLQGIRVDWIRSNGAVCAIVCAFACKEIAEGRWH